MSLDLMRDIAHLRRNMPRNEVAMRVCDALEGLLTKVSQQTAILEDAAKFTDGSSGESRGYKRITVKTAKFDRNAYQRELMRKKRAEGKK